MSLSTSNITIESKAFGQPVPNLKSSISRIVTSSVATNDNDTMIIHTTNAIQGNAIKQEEPVIRKAILSNNAIFVARHSVKKLDSSKCECKIISQLNNDRIDTTQGIDMTKN
jgi:hypothetical protein